MNYLILLIVLLFACRMTLGSQTCDGKTYNEIYRMILRRAIDSKMTPEDVSQKVNAIETLKKLCHGQLSDLERGKK